MKKDGEKSAAEKIIDVFEEDEMKKEVKKEVIRLLKEAKENKEEIDIVRELKLQYSKQFFVRFPRDLEKTLGLKKGKNIKFILRINPDDSDKKLKIELEIK